MSMPRDGGDPQEDERPAPPTFRTIDIRVGGVVVGTVDTRTLKARAQFDVEEGIASPTPATALLRWLQQYAGLSDDDTPQVKEEISEMPVSAIIDLFVSISEAIGRGMQLPPKSRRASRRL